MYKIIRMKKVIIFCLTLASSVALSQELKSKKGENYLPEAKDCALQIDAVPFLDYTGKLLSNTGASSPSIASPAFAPFTIGGKYFTSNAFAYRAKLRIGAVSSTVKNSVINNSKTTADTVYTSDSRNIKNTNITVSFGFEKRRGKTRLQGYYGAEGFLKIAGGGSKYSYGNSFTSDNPSVFTTDFNTIAATGYANSLQQSRIVQTKNGTTFGLGARAFFGVEYFIFPKISLGAELGWGVSYMNTNDGFVKHERWDNANLTTVRKNTPLAGNSSFGVDTDNTGGQILLSFHF